jgi:tellurite resistance protein
LKTQALLSCSTKIGASSSSDFTEMWLEFADIMNLLKASSRHMADVVSTKVVVAD